MLRFLASAVLAIVLTGAVARAETFHQPLDFTITNPAGPWTFGSMTRGTKPRFEPFSGRMRTDQAISPAMLSAYGRGGAMVGVSTLLTPVGGVLLSPGNLLVRPDMDRAAAIRFRATRTARWGVNFGVVRLSASPQQSTVQVLRNGKDITGQIIPGASGRYFMESGTADLFRLTGGAKFYHTAVISLTRGDELIFVFDNGMPMYGGDLLGVRLILDDTGDTTFSPSGVPAATDGESQP